MSKSRSNKKGNPFPKASRRDDARGALPIRPWIKLGRDYGPARAALADLVAWAFQIAERDVADWPEGQRRVRTAKKYVIGRLSGQEPRSLPFEDIVFTAGLLTRVFDDELNLGISEMLTILDELGLPTDMVPLVTRAPAQTPSPRSHRGCDDCNPMCLRFRNAA